MKRKGRPPHPDVLTPREWDVLTLMREDLTNQQIAERLGISFDAAKYHVAEILSKLGLESREEAAAWQPEPPERPVLRPAWARALAPIAGLWRAWPIAARIAGATVVAAAAGGLGVLAYGVLRSGGDADDDIARPTATASASATPREVRVQPGQTIRVLGTSPPVASGPPSCEDEFVNLGSPASDVITCIVGPEAPRLIFSDRGDGVLRLESVELTFLGKSTRPAASGTLNDCTAWFDTLLGATSDPATATQQIACRASVDSGGSIVASTLAWIRVPQSATAPDATQPCWTLAPAAGAVADGSPLKSVRCGLYQPTGPAPTPSAFIVANPIALPPNLSIVIQTGCCEMQISGLIRVSRSASGETTRQVLFSAGTHNFITADGSVDSRDDFSAGGVVIPTPNPQASSKAPAEDRPYIATYGISADARAIVIGLCTRGACEGVNAAPNDQGLTQLYRSLDGGDTWSELEQLGPYVHVSGVTAAGRALVATSVPGSKGETYAWEPGGEAVTPPALVTGAPTVLVDGRVIWPGPLGVLYLGDGTILASGLGLPQPWPVIEMGNGQFALQTSEGLAIVQNGEVTETYPGLGVGAYLGNGVFVETIAANRIPGSGASVESVPALIDTRASTITPITSPFLDVGSESSMFTIIVGAVTS